MTRAARLGPAARFFFYGTLLDPDIRVRVLGRALGPDRLEPASVAGFRRVRAVGKWYPILVPGLAGDVVDGAVASKLTRGEIAALIAYEGEGYDLVPVTARLTASGAAVSALVFLPAGGLLRPSNQPWELERWQREDKPRVMRRGSSF